MLSLVKHFSSNTLLSVLLRSEEMLPSNIVSLARKTRFKNQQNRHCFWSRKQLAPDVFYHWKGRRFGSRWVSNVPFPRRMNGLWESVLDPCLGEEPLLSRLPSIWIHTSRMSLSLRRNECPCLIHRKLFKSLSSSFLKAVRKIEPEVVAKLEEGNKEDHARHEDYVLSFLEDPLKTQICSYLLNR